MKGKTKQENDNCKIRSVEREKKERRIKNRVAKKERNQAEIKSGNQEERMAVRKQEVKEKRINGVKED